jgi:nitroreductase
MEAPLEHLLRAQTHSDLTYRPLIFTLPKDEAALRSLLKAEGIVQVIDRLPAQLRELLKSLHPQVKFTEDLLQEYISKHLDGKDLISYGSWVFYPWNQRLVHLLGAAEYALVRTDRNRNKITREEQAVLAQKKVGVIGLSVGQSVSLTMALERSFGEIRLADFDTLDLTNLNRIRTGVHHLGMNKAVITAREIAEIDPYLNVICFTAGLTQENMDAFFSEGGKLDILVEECDSVDIKILARQKAKALGIPVVMDMSDRGCLDVERFDLEPSRPIMHGWIDHLDLEAAKRPMSAEEKVPFMLPITGVETLSPRMKASVIELGQTLSTWPQLATSVTLGGALAGDAVRRIALGLFTASGRWHVDLEEQIKNTDAAELPPSAPDIPFKLLPNEIENIDDLLGLPPTTSVTLNQRVLEQIVEAGGMAPSMGNMQPWAFLWHGNRLLLFHDQARSQSIWDPQQRMARLALGACVENIVMKAHELGLEVGVRSLGNRNRLFAAFTFFHRKSELTEPHVYPELSTWISKRITDRNAGVRKLIPENTLSDLKTVCDEMGLKVSWVIEAKDLQELAQIHGNAVRIQQLHSIGHREYFSGQLRWSAREADERRDGLDISTFGLPPMAEAAMKVMADEKVADLLRSWNGGKALALLPTWTISSSAVVASFHVEDFSDESVVKAARAIQRFWLAAESKKVGVQPVPSILNVLNLYRLQPDKYSLNTRKELAIMEQKFDTLFHQDGDPLFLMRLVPASFPRKSAQRRSLSEVLLTQVPISQ